MISCLAGRTLATAESCTGGGIGAALTAISGASAVYKGGIISYCNELKQNLLGVPAELLESSGAVSAPVAEAMAAGVRKVTGAEIGVSVTGLACPGGVEFGNSVGTVYIGYVDGVRCISKVFHFPGDREQVRQKSIEAALKLIIEYI